MSGRFVRSSKYREYTVICILIASPLTVAKPDKATSSGVRRERYSLNPVPLGNDHPTDTRNRSNATIIFESREMPGTPTWSRCVACRPMPPPLTFRRNRPRSDILRIRLTRSTLRSIGKLVVVVLSPSFLSRNEASFQSASLCSVVTPQWFSTPIGKGYGFEELSSQNLTASPR